MTRDDRPTSRDRDQTQPDGIAARVDETAQTPSRSLEGGAPNDSTRKPFNPWRFGFHTVSAEHRRELLEMQLPETPAERLFDPSALDSKPDASASAPPALTVDAEDEANEGAAARKADTLRLRRGPPLVSPFRTAAPWAAGAALLVLALLWLLTGRSEPERPSTSAAAPRPTTSAPPNVARNEPLKQDPPSEASPESTAVADDVPKAAKPGVASKRPEAPKIRPAEDPSPTAAPSPPTVAPPPPTKKPPSDDASPFGTWTAPPRD